MPDVVSGARRGPHWYTPAQAAALLGEKTATVSKRCQRGTWPVRDAHPGRGSDYRILGSFVRAELKKPGQS